MPGSSRGSPTFWASASRWRHPETTALGAAFLAGQASGLYGSQEDLQRSWVPSRAFEPAMSEAERKARYGGWRDALAKVKSKL